MTDLLLDIYDAAADASLWPGVLDKVAHAVGAWGCLIFDVGGAPAGPPLRVPHASTVYDTDLLAFYMKAFEAEEMDEQARLARLVSPRDGIELVPDTALADSAEALASRANVQALRTYGIGARSFGLLDKDNRTRLRLSVQHAVGRGPMTQAEEGRLAALLPHLAKALHLGQPAAQIRALEAGLIAAMDQLAIGLCLLDRGGHMVHANAEFRRQIADSPQISLDAVGRVRLARDRDQAALARLTTEPAAHGQFGARPRKEALGTAQEGALCIELTPLRTLAELGSTPLDGALLSSIDTTRPTALDTRPLAQVFGLTPAEAALAACLAQGHTNAQMAQDRGRAVSTVNVQVKSLLAKTGCANRTQFVRLLLTFSPSLLRAPKVAAGTFRTARPSQPQ